MAVVVVVEMVTVVIMVMIVVGWFLRREQTLFALYTDLKRNPQRLKDLQKYRRHSRAAHPT